VTGITKEEVFLFPKPCGPKGRLNAFRKESSEKRVEDSTSLYDFIKKEN
jgi:hypothetical protein